MITLTTNIKRIWLVTLFLAFCAQSGELYTMDSSVQAPAGGSTAAGEYQLQGTFGQPAVGHTSGGEFTLHSGFWATTPPPNDLIFADNFE
ncbi:hypothetical protein [Marinicella meishanensis]|uniref:hypothetical protein n=1 Tax=Marinicella meishanensis TaxID=2873263 RepID=UPI001CBCFC6D|nr:hypothetical protein [Marinicella sp. NBU2979]